MTDQDHNRSTDLRDSAGIQVGDQNTLNNNPGTLNSRTNLATAYEQIGRLDDAKHPRITVLRRWRVVGTAMLAAPGLSSTAAFLVSLE